MSKPWKPWKLKVTSQFYHMSLQKGKSTYVSSPDVLSDRLWWTCYISYHSKNWSIHPKRKVVFFGVEKMELETLETFPDAPWDFLNMFLHSVSLSQWTLQNKSLNFIFPTKYVIPKSLKFSHWPSKQLIFILKGKYTIQGASRICFCF